MWSYIFDNVQSFKNGNITIYNSDKYLTSAGFPSTFTFEDVSNLLETLIREINKDLIPPYHLIKCIAYLDKLQECDEKGLHVPSDNTFANNSIQDTLPGAQPTVEAANLIELLASE